MDSQLWWWFIIFLLNSIESRHLLNSNEPTNKNQTSTNSTDNTSYYQSTYSTSLAKITTTIHSNNTIQSLITKPNSYLYNSDEDEILLDRIKRESAPFVCKSKISIPLIYILLNIF
jgi:hypothetical protein